MTSRRRLYWTLTVVFTLLATGLAYYLSLKVPDMGPTGRLGWVTLSKRAWTTVGIITAVLAFLFPFLLSAWESWQARSVAADAEASATARQTQIVGALLPVTDALAKLSLLPTGGSDPAIEAERQRLQAAIKIAVLSSVVNLYDGPTNARAVYYRLSGSPGSRALTPEAPHQGRGTIPNRVFHETTPEGREALAALEMGIVRQWKVGMSGPTPPGWSGAKSYKGYVAVPVAVSNPGQGGATHGMLTFDVLDPESLTFGPSFGPNDPQARLDGETVETFARLLASALNN